MQKWEEGRINAKMKQTAVDFNVGAHETTWR